jgi:hypothetical protein
VNEEPTAEDIQRMRRWECEQVGHDFEPVVWWAS